MTERKTYRATAKPSGAWWAISIEGLPDGLIGVTQAWAENSWSEVEKTTRECIAVLLDIEPDTFDVEIRKEGE